MRVFIDPGHGAHDPGASANGLVEKSINLIVGKLVKGFLESKNIQVKMSREDDSYPSLQQRAADANAWNADYFISIHHNAGMGDGYEIIYSVNEGRGKELAEKIGRQFEAIGQNKRKIYYRTNSKGTDYYAVIRLTNMPAIITEFAFIDSKDVEIIDTKDKLLKEAEAIANGILKQIGVEPIRNEFEAAVNKLVEKEIINSPDYWINNAVQGKQVNGEYAQILIKRVAKLLG